jgi:phospholipid-translocating ATPase
VVASGTALAMVIYSGRETRAVMNTNFPETKVGLVDLEINKLSKVVCEIRTDIIILIQCGI